MENWGGPPTLRWYGLLLSDGTSSVLGIPLLSVMVNSIIFALMTVVITVPMAIASALWARKRRLGGMIPLIPVAVSSVTLAWAYIGAFLHTPLYGSWLLIVIAHSVIAFPLVFRSVFNQSSSMDEAMVDAARTLGANRFRAFLHAVLPQLRPGILVGASFAFAISIGEFGATLLLYRPEYTTIPIAIYRILGTRAFGSAAAMSVILMIFATASFLLIDRMGSGQERSAF
jgi:thiamine transport system permease protein